MVGEVKETKIGLGLLSEEKGRVGGWFGWSFLRGEESVGEWGKNVRGGSITLQHAIKEKLLDDVRGALASLLSLCCSLPPLPC